MSNDQIEQQPKKEFNVDEIVHVLQKGEKEHRIYRDGLDVALSFKALVNQKADLLKSIENDEKLRETLQNELHELREGIKKAELQAKQTLIDAEEKAAGIISKAQEDILVSQNKAEDELEDAARSLAAVKDEVAEAEVERDTIKAEIRELEEIKEKTRKQILGGTAPASTEA